MPAEPPEGLVEGVGREGGSDDARLFAEILPALLREDARHLVHQDSRLLAREDFRQKEVTFLVELRELFLGELHCNPPIAEDLGKGPPCRHGVSATTLLHEV